MTRPDRLSLCRWGGRATSLSRWRVSSFATALNRRFGASVTREGNRNAPFSASIFGSDIMLPPDSEGRPVLDVSYQFFTGYEKAQHLDSLRLKVRPSPISTEPN